MRGSDSRRSRERSELRGSVTDSRRPRERLCRSSRRVIHSRRPRERLRHYSTSRLSLVMNPDLCVDDRVEPVRRLLRDVRASALMDQLFKARPEVRDAIEKRLMSDQAVDGLDIELDGEAAVVLEEMAYWLSRESGLYKFDPVLICIGSVEKPCLSVSSKCPEAVGCGLGLDHAKTKSEVDLYRVTRAREKAPMYAMQIKMMLESAAKRGEVKVNVKVAAADNVVADRIVELLWENNKPDEFAFALKTDRLGNASIDCNLVE